MFEHKKLEVFISDKILKELARVLTYPKIKEPLDKAGINQEDVIRGILKRVLIVQPQEKIRTIKEDPADNKILECAIGSVAEYVISGDRHLLELKEFRGIKIVTPRKFLEIIKGS